MQKIGLLSDTHGWLDQQVFSYFASCDEIWHAGDLGSEGLAAQLRSFRPLKAVYGNIDSPAIRREFPESLSWECEEVKIFMTHIGGTPPRYNRIVKLALEEQKPGLFICGHSHILRIQFDHAHQVLFMNPGAAGSQGWHKMRTLVRFSILGKEIKDCEVIELGERAKSESR
jgi:putative phosphoesterase